MWNGIYQQLFKFSGISWNRPRFENIFLGSSLKNMNKYKLCQK